MYTNDLREPLETISWEDDDFIEQLLEVAKLFRPFSVAMDEFLIEHGYKGSISSTDEKVEFIRSVFTKANMDSPREIREWFSAGQDIQRETAFQICFAFGLDGFETDEFFRRVFSKERSFNCHQIQEAIYYFCLNNGLSWADAMDIQSQVSLTGKVLTSSDVVYTGSIIKELNNMESKEELVIWLNENIDKFVGSNVTAYETIQRLWQQAAGPNGLLLQEHKLLPSMLDDSVAGKKSKLWAENVNAKPWDAYLAILQLDKKDVKKLGTDRSIKPILEKLHDSAQDSFPDRQGIDRILRGEHVSYERVRKWLILLTFYTFWAKKAIDKGNYEANTGDADRCITSMNQHLIDSGYPELYVGNPYDWIFFYATKSDEPLFVFRYIWNELLTGTLEEHQ